MNETALTLCDDEPAGWLSWQNACTLRFSPATQESTGKPISIDHLWNPYFGWPNPIKPIQTPTFDDVHRKITHLIWSPWNFPYIWVKSPSEATGFLPFLPRISHASRFEERPVGAGAPPAWLGESRFGLPAWPSLKVGNDERAYGNTLW